MLVAALITRAIVTTQLLDEPLRQQSGHLAQGGEAQARLLAREAASRDVAREGVDHALDHLNQIDQWLAWQRDGVVPTPTDGWVGSSVTLPGDLLPLSSSDLDAWLWRVDQAARLVRQRAGELTQAELDWQPPDSGWPLRRVLHHLARSERLYAASIDEALPGGDPTDRYEEACRRLDETLRTAVAGGEDTSIVYAGLYGVLQSREEVVDLVLSIESELLGPRTQ